MRRLVLIALVVAVSAMAAPGTSSAGADAPPSTTTGVEPALTARATELAALETPLPLPFDRPPRLLFVGDSVADTLAGAMAAETAGRGGTMARSIHPGCGLLPGLPTTLDGYTPPWADACSRAVPDWRAQVARTPADLVLVLSSWDGGPRLLDGVFVDPATPEGREAFVGLMRELIDAVAPLGSGRGVVLLAEAIPARGATTGDPSPSRITEARHHRAVLRATARTDPGRVRIVDMGQWLCPTGSPCPELVEGVHARPDDGGHFSADGAAWVVPRLLDALAFVPR